MRNEDKINDVISVVVNRLRFLFYVVKEGYRELKINESLKKHKNGTQISKMRRLQIRSHKSTTYSKNDGYSKKDGYSKNDGIVKKLRNLMLHLLQDFFFELSEIQSYCHGSLLLKMSHILQICTNTQLTNIGQSY